MNEDVVGIDPVTKTKTKIQFNDYINKEFEIANQQ